MASYLDELISSFSLPCPACLNMPYPSSSSFMNYERPDKINYFYNINKQKMNRPIKEQRRSRNKQSL